MAGDRLVGFKELPGALGVSRATAQRYSRRDDFPSPVERLAAGPIWLLADVERWKREHLPLRRGRPPQAR